MFTDYSPPTIEPRWQGSWEQAGLYRAVETGNRPKDYCLEAASHIAEVLWYETGYAGSLPQQSWLTWDETLAEDEFIETRENQVSGIDRQ